MIHIGDNREIIKTFESNSFDSVVTDPPYELGFMGKSWDSSGIAYDITLWREVLRVMKPGAHLLAFGGTRTYHRMVCAIEDAGFEIRDQMQWIYGSGFPKSMDVSKAIDKAAGATREQIGTQRITGRKGEVFGEGKGKTGLKAGDIAITAAATDDAKKWEGWGTALKPANEPVVLARKPLEGTVAANVLKWGTGALNIDACRIPIVGPKGYWPGEAHGDHDGVATDFSRGKGDENAKGRWPANVVLDAEAGAILDGQEVGAARFYYCAKPSTEERERGTEERERKPLAQGNQAQAEVKRGNTGHGGDSGMNTVKMRGNIHPTVKPVDLMAYLIKLVTPQGGVVLDPFLGSGTTAIAAESLMFRWVGCELSPEYSSIAAARIAAETKQGKLL